MNLAPDVLATIGRTPLVRLRKLTGPGHARIVVKVEGANPTGSMKDRMALAMIEAAERDGRLKPGGKVVEYTGGSTGTSLALVCGARGYPLLIVTSNAASAEKRTHMRALGAELTELHTEGGKQNKELIGRMIETTAQIARDTGAFWTDQLKNVNQAEGYHALGAEIWEQTGGRVDAFVQVVGTCGSLRGVSTTLRRLRPGLRVVAVEPAESPVLSGGAPGSHRIEGIGIGGFPPLWDKALVDKVETVSTAEADAMARRLAIEEGLFAGSSSGANVVAALRVAASLGPEATVATILVDSGLKYLSTDLYKRS